MGRAKEVLGMVNEGKEDVGMADIALQIMLDLLTNKVFVLRGDIEMGLDDAGLLDGKEGKLFYKADNLLDKAEKEFKKLQKQLKAKYIKDRINRSNA